MGYWFIAGDRREEYTVEPAPDRWRGMGVVNLRCRVESPHGFGTLMRDLPPAPFQDYGCRLTGWLRPVDVTSWAGLWARVDGPPTASADRGHMLAFDNMGDRPVRGTADWRQYEVVLDVPRTAVNLAYGVLLAGEGVVSIAALRLTPAPPGLRRTGGPPHQLGA